MKYLLASAAAAALLPIAACADRSNETTTAETAATEEPYAATDEGTTVSQTAPETAAVDETAGADYATETGTDDPTAGTDYAAGDTTATGEETGADFGTGSATASGTAETGATAGATATADTGATAGTDAGMASASGSMTMPANAVSVAEVLGKPVTGADGSEIGRVDDVIINESGKAEALVLTSADGSKRARVEFSQIQVAGGAAAGPSLTTTLPADSLASMPDFTTDEAATLRLASEIVGASATLGEAGQEAQIADLLLETDGDVPFVIVASVDSDAAVGAAASEAAAGVQYAIPIDKLSVEQGDGGIVLDVSDLSTEMRFEAAANR